MVRNYFRRTLSAAALADFDMRILFSPTVLCLALLAFAAVVTPTPAAAQTMPIQVCVVMDGELRVVTADFNTATGDTTSAGQPFRRVFPSTTPPYAAGAVWYIGNDPLTLDGRSYRKAWLPRVVEPDKLVRAGEYRGVPLFAWTESREPHEVRFVPVRPGCDFEPYRAERPETATLGGGPRMSRQDGISIFFEAIDEDRGTFVAYYVEGSRNLGATFLRFDADEWRRTGDYATTSSYRMVIPHSESNTSEWVGKARDWVQGYRTGCAPAGERGAPRSRREILECAVLSTVAPDGTRYITTSLNGRTFRDGEIANVAIRLAKLPGDSGERFGIEARVGAGSELTRIDVSRPEVERFIDAIELSLIATGRF
jgi:hypothetical protein